MNHNPNREHFTEDSFEDITQQLRELLFKKGKAYNKKSLVYDYFPYGTDSMDTLIWIKALREMNTPSEENLVDLILYSMFKLNWLALQKCESKLLKEDAL